MPPSSSLISRATALLNRSRLLTNEARFLWLNRLSTLDDDACIRLVGTLEQESKFLKGELEIVLQKALQQGDRDTVEAFKQSFTAATRSVGAKEEAKDKIEESEELKHLESDLNAL